LALKGSITRHDLNVEVVAIMNTGVSIELTPDGYTVTCPGTHITGHGPTETRGTTSGAPTTASGNLPALSQLPTASTARNAHAESARILRIRNLFD
jgi:hypothetical protein